MITGLPDNKTIVTNIAITKLAKEAKKDIKVRELINKLPSSEFLERLDKDEELKEFSYKFNEFMSDYGHRSHTREIYYPRWIDDPSLVTEVLKSLIDSAEVDLEEVERERGKKDLRLKLR